MSSKKIASKTSLKLSRISRPALSFLVAAQIGCLSVLNCAAATAPVNENLTNPQQMLDSSASDARALVRAMLDRMKQLKSYSIETVLCTYKGKKPVVETGKLLFKNPNLIKFECVNAGKRSGAVVVRQPDGKIKGKMGGALGGIKLTLSPDSKLLRTANDFSILECDLGSLLTMTMSKMTGTTQCKVGTIAGGTQIIELADNGSMISRMSIDAKSKLPDLWSLFKDNAIFSTAGFSNMKLIADLPDSSFSLSAPSGDDLVLLAAHERGAGLSVSSYRLQLEMQKMQEESEDLASNLGLWAGQPARLAESGQDLQNRGTGRTGGSTGSMQPVQLAERAANLERCKLAVSENVSMILGIKLSSGPIMAADKSSWRPAVKEQLLFSASQIELLLSAMEKAQDAQLMSPGNSDYKAMLCSFRKAASELIAFCQADEPDNETFAGLKANLKECADQLMTQNLN